MSFSVSPNHLCPRHIHDSPNFRLTYECVYCWVSVRVLLYAVCTRNPSGNNDLSVRAVNTKCTHVIKSA